jgi:hypothetical protein
MPDREFLIWLHDRLTDVHRESPIKDYMHKLRAIIRATDKKTSSPNINTGNSVDWLR